MSELKKGLTEKLMVYRKIYGLTQNLPFSTIFARKTTYSPTTLHADRIAEEKKADRHARLQEREKTEWDRKNEAKKAAMIIEQDEYVKSMEDKVMKKEEEKRAERAERAARGEATEEESTIIEEEMDDAASSVYDQEVPDMKADAEMGNVLDQVENFEENEVRPDMGGGLMDWVNEAKAQEHGSDTVVLVGEDALKSEAERLEAEIEAQAAESVLSEPVL